MKRILVVEDESKIARLVRDYLEHAGFEVAVAGDGDVALAEARRSRPDLVVLDLGLPGRDGLDVARGLRRVSNVPIVMLTARGDETDRIVGLELGADDYVVKPFSGAEVIARIRAVLRRTGSRAAAATETAEPVTVGELELDPGSRRAHLKGAELQLSRKEFDLLAELVTHAGRVVTREDLMSRVWDENWFGSTKTLDVHIAAVRRKLGDRAGAPGSITTIRGIGYRLEAEGPAGSSSPSSR